jgi:DNA-binding response OmpR family regulator
MKSKLPLKLLLVEDDLAHLQLMTEILASLEAEVHPVSDSLKAAAMVDQQRFDGIFLDLEMPGLHGFELARRIRASSWNKSTPIIIVSGRDERDTMREAFRIGANFYLQKPIDRRRVSVLFRAARGGMLENRRRHTRAPIQAAAEFTVGSRKMHGVTWNISPGGMQVEAGDLRAHDIVQVSFRMPASGVALEATGTVVWAGENRQGIRFSNLSVPTEEAIRKFIADLENSLPGF